MQRNSYESNNWLLEATLEGRSQSIRLIKCRCWKYLSVCNVYLEQEQGEIKMFSNTESFHKVVDLTKGEHQEFIQVEKKIIPEGIPE